MSQDTKQGVLITQEDVDAALAAFRPPGPDEAAPLFLDESDIVETGEQADVEDSEFFGLLSQEDIEALLHGDLEGAGPNDAQNEIDNLVHSAISEKEPSPEPGASDDTGGAAQADVEALLRKASEESGGVAGGKEDIPAEGAMIAQDDIDRLLMSALDEVGEEPVDTAGAGESGGLIGQDDIDQLLAGEPEPDEAPGATAPSPDEVVSQDDIERLLAEASEEDESAVMIDFGTPDTGPEGEAESLISQADLDRLIAGEDPGAGEGMPPDSGDKPAGQHISQDDINRLLKESFEAPEPPAEAAPAEEPSEGGAPGPESAPEPEAAPEPEPVILAADEASPPPVAPGKKRKPAKVRGKRSLRVPPKFLVWGSAAAGAVIVCVALLTMIGGERPPAPQPEVLTFSVPQVDTAVTEDAGSGKKSIRFPGFVVLVPGDQAAATYVAADLTLETSDAATASVIKENEPVVRNIIYGAISEALKTQDITAIDEASLALAIRKALDRIITRGAIDRIAFDSLSLV